MKSGFATERIGDGAVSRKTGKNWAEWFRLLDAVGARAMDHKGVVAALGKHRRLGGWWQQMIAVAYEQARGKRRTHEKPEGFSVSSSKTVDVPVARLYAAWANERARRRWLAGDRAFIRKATPHKSLRIAWDGGATRVDVNLYAKGAGKSQVTAQHERLPNASAARRMQAYWKKNLEKLKVILEGA